jgi:hypothetical protein
MAVNLDKIRDSILILLPVKTRKAPCYWSLSEEKLSSYLLNQVGKEQNNQRYNQS